MVSTTKPNNPTYNYAVAGRPDYSQFVCAFCRNIGHVMWRCNKYLALNLNERHEYAKRNGRCTNYLSRHTIKHCPSQRSDIQPTSTGNHFAPPSLVPVLTPMTSSSNEQPANVLLNEKLPRCDNVEFRETTILPDNAPIIMKSKNV